MSASTAVVVGAGLAGLTTAALLVRAGWSVDLLEAHVDPGGCAATFRRGGYAFDAGATLFAGFAPEDAHGLVAAALGMTWPVRPLAPGEPAMRVWLGGSPTGAPAAERAEPGAPGGDVVDCFGDPGQWQAERRRAFPGAGAERFWREQASVARRLWPLAAQVPAWPPAGPGDLARLGAFGARALWRSPGLLGLAPRWRATVAERLLASGAGDARLRRFCDAQLLITAQATADTAAWLYGAVALDLARHGPVHVAGGAGALAAALERRYAELGGRIHFRTRARAIELDGAGRAVAVRDQRGRRWPERGAAGAVVANLTPGTLAGLLGTGCPPPFRRRVATMPPAWGAFTLYLGVDAALVDGAGLHHQVVADEGTLGEGRSVFVSVSPPWDDSRAPAGQRAVTVSTHTAVEPWWELYRQRTTAAREVYRRRRNDYAERCLAMASRALPGLATRPEGIRLLLPGTPITFARFTGRVDGRVGGLPQTSLGGAFPARVLRNLWLVGDYIFPGQSSASTLLGALRVSREIARRSRPAGI